MAQKATPKKATAPRDQSARKIAKLESDVRLLAWLHAEMAHQQAELLGAMRMMAARQILANPQVQQHLTEEMARRMAAGQTPNIGGVMAPGPLVGSGMSAPPMPAG